MKHLILTLDEDLVRALMELANWEKRQEIVLAAELVRLALEKAAPQRELRFLFATLTEREKILAGMAARGFSYAQISQRLFISPETVKTHMRNIRRKMEVRSNEELKTKIGLLPAELLNEEEDR